VKLIYPFGLPIALSLVGYNSLLTGVLIWCKRKDIVGLRYLISSTFVAGWGIGLSFQLNNDLPILLAQAWARFAQQCVLFIPVTWLHFVLVYTQANKREYKILSLAYALTLLIFPFTFTSWYVAGFRPMVEVRHYPIPGLFYGFFTLLFAILVAYSFFILAKRWKTADSSEQKLDYKFLFIAQSYGFLTGALSFLPVYGIPCRS
jgi:hypothetical protein